MKKVTIQYNGKKFKIPFISCDDCAGKDPDCKKCLKRSFEEACINAGQTKLLGGEWN